MRYLYIIADFDIPESILKLQKVKKIFIEDKKVEKLPDKIKTFILPRRWIFKDVIKVNKIVLSESYKWFKDNDLPDFGYKNLSQIVY